MLRLHASMRHYHNARPVLGNPYGAGGYDVWLIKVSQGNGTLPPLTPAITGSISGKVNTEYPYTSSTTDPEEDQVFYWFDWG
jgi:hypothetical protein